MKHMRRHIPELAIGFCAALCILLLALTHTNPGFTRYASAVNPFFMLPLDAVTEEEIDGYAGVRRTYTFTLPETESVTTIGARLTFYLRHTIAQIEVEDSTLYNDLSEHDTRHIGKTPGNYWVSVPVRPAFAGKTVRVTLTPVYKSVRDDEPSFLVISRDSLLNMIELPEDGLSLCLSVVAVAAGLFLSLISLALPLEGEDRKRIFYLGAVTVAAGLWKLCGLPALTLFLDYWNCQKEIWFLGAVSYLLMLTLSLRLLAAIRADGENRARLLCFYLSALTAAALLLLQTLGLAELHDALSLYGFGMAVLHLVPLLLQRPSRQELLWQLPFFLTLCADLLIYSYTGSMRKAPMFLIWITGNLFVRGVGFVREAVLRESAFREKERELRDARIKSMMNQIRPHFIYNTLVSVYELCRDEPTQAMRVIDDFITYLHANFSAVVGSETIPFREELTHTQAYLAVETVLHGDDLSVEYDTEVVAFRLPPLTLQTIVENAVKYGVGMWRRPEHIVIRTRAGEKGVTLSVEDNGGGYNPQPDSEVHVGLRNVRERLELICGGTLGIAPRPEGGTVVTVSIPQR